MRRVQWLANQKIDFLKYKIPDATMSSRKQTLLRKIGKRHAVRKTTHASLSTQGRDFI
jgi:hypothetical protein